MFLRDLQWLDEDGAWQRGDVRVHAGRIVELGPALDHRGDEVLAGDGMKLVPGAIDPHTHLRAPGKSRTEGVARGSRAALAGGVTTLLDMPNNRPPTSTAGRLEQKRQIFRRQCRTHWGLHGHASASGSFLDPRGIPAIKIYMAKSSELPALVDVDALSRVFMHYPVVAVHAEDERCFGSGPRHGARRPRSAVVRALDSLERALLRLPEDRRPRLVLCHATTVEEISWLRRLKVQGFDVWGETCPHYLAFTEDDVERSSARLQVNPPIRLAEDRAALRAALVDGTLDFIATDHAPHLPGEKLGPNPPSGIASIEWLLPFATQLVEQGLIGWRRLTELCTRNAAACYRIPGRGAIAPGQVADLVVLAPRDRVEPRHTVVTGAGWTPYCFEQFDHAVYATLVAGRVAYLDGTWPPGVLGEELYT